MAMVTTRVEPYTEVFGFANTLRDLGISPSMSFSEIMSKTSMHNFGYTDASLLMNHAKSNQIKVDTFIVITDNEVNHGGHPSQALNNYRQAMGINARLVVMGMTATDFTIADPTDRGMLDVCGFDSNTPKVVADFSAGRF
jgi:60 kDa SS-A/Ro ribonucleoprotein